MKYIVNPAQFFTVYFSFANNFLKDFSFEFINRATESTLTLVATSLSFS